MGTLKTTLKVVSILCDKPDGETDPLCRFAHHSQWQSIIHNLVFFCPQ